MNSEFLPVVKCSIDNTLDQWLQGNKSLCPLCFLDDAGIQLFSSNILIGKQDESEKKPERLWI